MTQAPSPTETDSPKHTPGPWKAIDWFDRHPQGMNGEPIRRGEYFWIKLGDNVSEFSAWSSEADARLLAAAPELLEALQTLVANVLDYEHVNKLSPNPGRKYCWDSVERAVEVIAKATGKPPQGAREQRAK